MAASDIINAIGQAIINALRPSTRRGGTPTPRSGNADDYPGDFDGRTTLNYAPHSDKVADPGEVVWTWVPYEEDHSQGKDRPVLVIGRDGRWLLALPMTSKDHDRDAAQEASEGRYWTDIGSGAWDSEHRASEVRVNRIVRVDPASVRRISARVSPEMFARVAEAVRRYW